MIVPLPSLLGNIRNIAMVDIASAMETPPGLNSAAWEEIVTDGDKRLNWLNISFQNLSIV